MSRATLQTHAETWRAICQAWKPDFEPQLVVLFQIGSHSHGTYIPPADPNGIDDVDYMAIVMPPVERVLGLDPWQHAEVKEGHLDVIIYSWGKYVNLLRKSNPNVLGTLWIDESGTWGEKLSEVWSALRSHRQSFASKEAAKAFRGYVKQQLHEMTHCAGQGFLGRKRKELVERFGFDVKSAAHAIRLYRMCHELLSTGRMNVHRPDAAELVQIKRGQWPQERVMQEAVRLGAMCDEAEENSDLPERPDEVMIERLMIDGYLRGWNLRPRS